MKLVVFPRPVTPTSHPLPAAAVATSMGRRWTRFGRVAAILLLMILAAARVPPGASAQTAVLRPLALSGYNEDVIAEGVYNGSGSVRGSTTTAVDSQQVYYATGFNKNAPTVGLPAGNTFVNATNPNVTFLLQPAVGKNVLLLTDQASGISAGALTLFTPGSFSTLSILATGLESSNPVGYRLNFQDGGAPTEGSFIAADNFVGSAPVAISGFGRVNRTNGDFDNSSQDGGAPRLYAFDVTLSATDAARTLESITFTDLSPGPTGGRERRVAIFGVSGFGSSQAVLQPLPLSGYNQDVIAEGAGAPGNSTSVAIDGVYAYYARGFNARFPAIGLPAGGAFVSAANPVVNFALAPAAGANALLLNGPATGTLALVNPGRFSVLAALVTGLNGSNAGAYRLNFADNGLPTGGTFTAVDNFLNSPQVALAGFGRVERSGGRFDDSSQTLGDPHLFELDISLSPADAARPLSSITFTNSADTSSTPAGLPRGLAVFGLSGLLITPPAGNLAFSSAGFTVTESAGTATLSVQRTGGSAGIAQVNYATADGTARAGVAYTAVSGTLTWADGDSLEKTINVPIINRHLTQDATALLVNLSAAPGGVKVGAPSQAVLSILNQETTTDPIQAVNLLSPPTNLTVVQNQVIELYVEVEATVGGLAIVEFFVTDDNAPAGASGVSLGTSTAPRDRKQWVPPAAGRFHLNAVARDFNGRSKVASNPITVVPATSTDTGPRVELLGNLDGQQFAASSTITLVVSAVDARGQPLRSVQFYVDGKPRGAPVVPTVRGVRRSAADHHGPGTRDLLPAGAFAQLTAAVNNAVQLITAVGTDQNGVSAVSRGAQVYAQTGTNNGLSCVITAPSSGSTLSAAQAAGLTVSVLASEPGGTVRTVELFLNNTKVGESATAPFNFAVGPLAAGGYVLSATATDATNLSRKSEPVNLTVDPRKATVSVVGAGRERGGFLLSRPAESAGATLTVFYHNGGSASRGVDYETFSGVTTFAAGQTETVIPVRLLPGANRDKKVKVFLDLSPAGDYDIGKAQSKVFLSDL